MIVWNTDCRWGCDEMRGGWGVEGIHFLLGALADDRLAGVGSVRLRVGRDGLAGGRASAFASLSDCIYENITCSERVSFHHARV